MEKMSLFHQLQPYITPYSLEYKRGDQVDPQLLRKTKSTWLGESFARMLGKFKFGVKDVTMGCNDSSLTVHVTRNLTAPYLFGNQFFNLLHLSGLILEAVLHQCSLYNILLYGSSTWKVPAKITQKLQAFIIGVFWLETITNEKLGRCTGEIPMLFRRWKRD